MRIMLIGMFACLVVSCGFSSKSDEEYIAAAKTFYQKHDSQAAIIELKNALAQNPKNGEARALLGSIYTELGQGANAEKEFKSALTEGHAFKNIIIPLGESLLQQGKSDELIEQFKLQDTDSAEVVALKNLMIGEAYLQQQVAFSAKEHFQAALSSDTTKPRALLGLALLEVIDKRPEQALELVNQSLTLEKTPKAQLVLADVYRAMGDSENALAAFNQAANMSKDKRSYYYQIAMRQILFEQLKVVDTEKAAKTLATLQKTFYKEQFPSDIQLTHLRAILAYQQNNYEEATALTGKILLTQNNHMGAMLLAGTVDVIQEKYEQATSNLKRFLDFNPNHVQARKLLAFAQAKTRRDEEALATLSPLMEKSDQLDAQTLSLIASTALTAGQPEISRQYLQQALQISPEQNKLRFALAQTYIAESDFEAAIRALSSIKGAADETTQAQLSIAETHIKAKQYEKALDVLAELEQQLPENPLPASLKGTVYLLMGNTKAAKESELKALAIDESYLPATRLLAVLETQEGNLDKAVNLYESALEKHPENTQLLLEYSQALVQQKDYAKAEQTLKKAQNLDKEKATVLLARLYLAKGSAEQARAELLPLGDSNNSGVYAELGNAYMLLGDYQQALSSYSKLKTLEPKSEIAAYLVATAHMALENTEKSNLELEQAVALNPDFIPALLDQARIALNDKKTELAKTKVTKVLSLKGDNPTALALQGHIAMLQGESSEAVVISRNLYEQNPTGFTLQKYVQALWANGQEGEAKTVLVQRLTEEPENQEALYLMATAYQTEGNTQKAIGAYKQLIALNNQNVVALNNMAWLLKDSAPAEALEHAAKALELAPGNKDVQDTYKSIKENLN